MNHLLSCQTLSLKIKTQLTRITESGKRIRQRTSPKTTSKSSENISSPKFKSEGKYERPKNALRLRFRRHFAAP